eukprot:CAMPEP_0180595676 /NCGR_PEP_ID=MMETSP1037_2-20121125/21416_1 /TAXON_ID=632150 /ORGANISM="Azadinium spinosum, Strain 3D9" /LENGTH=118 /DNA_ID=CAMNT_0022614149 /DNA_START=22 /DNA_END=375 /DNA_ORIENTATION=+
MGGLRGAMGGLGASDDQDLDKELSAVMQRFGAKVDLFVQLRSQGNYAAPAVQGDVGCQVEGGPMCNLLARSEQSRKAEEDARKARLMERVKQRAEARKKKQEEENQSTRVEAADKSRF